MLLEKAGQAGFEGSGGGTSDEPMAFCLGRPGSNPGTDLGLSQFRIAVNLTGCRTYDVRVFKMDT